MTRTTNARLAGFTFLFYIAIAFPSMVLLDNATDDNEDDSDDSSDDGGDDSGDSDTA